MVNKNIQTKIKKILLSPLSKIFPHISEPKKFNFDFLSSADKIGALNTLAHYSMYSFEQHLLNKLNLYPYWESQIRTLEEWNTALPKRKKPIQPPKANKKAFWNYQYSYYFNIYEVTNYKRDKIQAIIIDPVQISEVVTFIQNHDQGWQLPPPSIGVHFDTVQLDILFYKGDDFLGSIGLKTKNSLSILIKDKTKHYAHQYLKKISDEEARFLFRLIDLDWDNTLLF